MPELPLRERLFVVVISFLLIFLTLLSHIHDSSENYPLLFTLEVQGAVVRPGSYTFTEHATLADIGHKAGFSENASLTGLKNKLLDWSEDVIIIPEKGYKVIYLKGAVKKEGPHIVKEEVRIKDLKALGLLQESADLKWIKRKRLLKNQEEVIVPCTNQK